MLLFCLKLAHTNFEDIHGMKIDLCLYAFNNIKQTGGMETDITVYFIHHGRHEKLVIPKTVVMFHCTGHTWDDFRLCI